MLKQINLKDTFNFCILKTKNTLKNKILNIPGEHSHQEYFFCEEFLKKISMEMYIKGISIKNICRELNIDKKKLYFWIKQERLDIRNLAIQLYYGGFSRDAICRRLKIKESKLLSWIDFEYDKDDFNYYERQTIQSGYSMWVSSIK